MQNDWYGSNYNPYAGIQFGNVGSNWSNNFSDSDDSENPYVSMLQNFYRRRSTPAMDQYMEHMAATPERSNYKPNLMTKIAGGLVGFGDALQGNPNSYKNMMNILDQPYMRAYEDWGNKAQRFNAAAQREQERSKSELDALKLAAESWDRNYNAQSSRMTAEAARTRAGNDTTRTNRGNFQLGTIGQETGSFDPYSGSFRPIGKSSGYFNNLFDAGEGAKNRASRERIAAGHDATAKANTSTMAGSRNRYHSPISQDNLAKARSMAIQNLLSKNQLTPEEKQYVELIPTKNALFPTLYRTKNTQEEASGGFLGFGKTKTTKPLVLDAKGQAIYNSLTKKIEAETNNQLFNFTSAGIDPNGIIDVQDDEGY